MSVDSLPQSDQAPADVGATSADGSMGLASDDHQPNAAAIGGAGGVGSWGGLWQVPTIVASLAAIAYGFHWNRQAQPGHDFEGAYAIIEQHVEAEEYDIAAAALEEQIAPKLGDASDQDRGHFFAISGDILAGSMNAERAWERDNLQLVMKRYRKASDFGYDLNVTNFEHWADAAIRYGNLETARKIVSNLEILALDSEVGREATLARNRVMRQLIKRGLMDDRVPFEEAIATIDSYREGALSALSDEIWASARQAELRIRDGRAQQAIDGILIDMRRFETQLSGPAGSDFGELYTLLANAYYQLGEFDFAQRQIEMAFDLIAPKDPRLAEAMLNNGRILAAQSRFDESLAAFATVADDFMGSPSYVAGLFGKADMNGVLGNHDLAQAQYALLADELPRQEKRLDVTPEIVVDNLAEQRHDAALARGELDLALDYIELTLEFMLENQLPEPALRRLASTNRAIAQKMMADAAAKQADVQQSVDPEVLRQVSRHYRAAAKYFVSRARALKDSPTDEKSWADSLWLAADSYDLAGYYEEAINLFKEYEGGRAATDPRWIEAKYRLGVCYQAVEEPSIAAAYFEEVIEHNRKSLWATRSHLPLAQCYLALERPTEAEQQLLGVVEGAEPLEPESIEFREALVALGTLYYHQGEYARAIEELTKAKQYYPTTHEIAEIKYRLADSARLNASEIRERLREELMPRSKAADLEALRLQQLRLAMDEFTLVVERLESRLQSSLDPLEREYLRNAQLYMADCAFDLGNIRQAIDLYDRVAQKYSKHPSSVVALVQIVNAYIALNDRDRAETAHHRALLRLQQLPEGAFEGEDAILNEEAWERWLEALPPGAIMSQAADDGPGDDG